MSKTNLKDKLQGDTLDLSMSEIEEVPVKDIAKIRQACILDLSNNKLVSLPKTFPTLTHIIKLDLSKNMLEELPENFGDMRQLRHLDLYSNQISRLPLSLGELKNLKWLDLKENPLTPAVASIAGLCSNAKECQLCARNVVSYLTNVKSSIEDEKQRRLNAVSSAEASKDVSTVKKDSKKKKKRAEAKDIKTKVDKDIVTPVKLGAPKTNGVMSATRLKSEITNSTSVTNHEKDGVTYKLCRILFILSFSLIALSFIAMIGIVTLPLFDPKGANAISTYLEVQTGLPITQYQQLGTQYLEKLVENVTLWTDEFRIVLTEMYAKYFSSTVSRSDL